MPPIKPLFTAALALLSLPLCPLAARAQGGLGQDAGVWRASPQGANQLGDAVRVGTWQVQKPSWARSISQITNNGRSALTIVQSWGSKPRRDGTFPMLILLTTNMPSTLSPPTPDGVMDTLESSALRGKTGLVIAAREHSSLHGLPAEREYWKYTAEGNGQVHGFFYATVQGQSFAAVTGMDAAPNHVLTLPALEAAALTLQSANPVAPSAPAIAIPAPLPAPAHPADFLGAETGAIGYKIRPPQGYTPVAVSDPDMQMAMWVGTKHPDGQAPTLLVARTPAPAPGASGASSPAQAILFGLLGSVQKHYQNVQTNPVRTGAINGIPAVYAYWTGTAAATGARMHGFGYGALDGGVVLVFLAMDSEPTQSATLPVLDTAIMTFRH